MLNLSRKAWPATKCRSMPIFRTTNPRPPRAGPIEASPSFAASDWRRLDDVHALPLRSESGREAKPTPAPYTTPLWLLRSPRPARPCGDGRNGGDHGGGTLTEIGSDPSWCADAAHRARAGDRHVAEDPAVVEVNASRTRFDTLRRASADLKSRQNKEKC